MFRPVCEVGRLDVEHRPKPKIRSACLKILGIRDCRPVWLPEFLLHEAARCVQDYPSNIDDGMCVVHLRAWGGGVTCHAKLDFFIRHLVFVDLSGKGLSGDAQGAAAHSESHTGSDLGVLESLRRDGKDASNALLAVCLVCSYSAVAHFPTAEVLAWQDVLREAPDDPYQCPTVRGSVRSVHDLSRRFRDRDPAGDAVVDCTLVVTLAMRHAGSCCNSSGNPRLGKNFEK